MSRSRHYRGTATALAALAAIGLGSTVAMAGGTLKIAREQDNTTFDPILTIQNADIWVMDNMNAGLARVTKDGLGLEPDLAEEWSISDDAKTYTFKLRDGIKFSDGSAVTAGDVKFSLERLRDQQDSVMASMYGIVAAIETPDEATVVVHLKEPSAPFLSTLAMFAASVVPEKAVKAEGADFGTKPVGAGAFKLDQWKRGDRVILTRNHDYWEDSRVKLDGVEWLYIADDNTRMLKLQAGEVDAAIFVPFNQIDTLQQNPDIQVHLDPSSREDHLLINHAHVPLGDVQVRRAICMAIDRQAIVKTVLFGHGEVANSIIPAGALYHNDANPTCAYDPDAAGKLLAQAGVGDDLELKLLIAAGNSIDDQTAVLIKDMLSKIGVAINIVKEEEGQQWNTQVAGDYDLSLGYWTNDIIDPDEKITFSLYGKDENKSFFTNYNNPKVTALIEQGRVTMNPDQRRGIYNQIQKIASDDVNWVDLYYSPFRNASRAYVKGFYQNPTGRFMLEDTDIVK
jgi:peptide/nickel transport system substrate-binding protein